MVTTDDEVDPEFIAYTPGDSKHTTVHLHICHNNGDYWSKAGITYESEGPRFMRELEYQVARTWVHIKRDIDEHEKRNALTNPFAWSRGPVGE